MKQGQQMNNLILVLFGCPATLSAKSKYTISSPFKFHASQNATMPFYSSSSATSSGSSARNLFNVRLWPSLATPILRPCKLAKTA